MVRSAQICKKCTILGNLRTITQERKKEIRQMTPFLVYFFSSTFSIYFLALTVCDIHFCIWKLPKFIFMGSFFHPFWFAKYLNFARSEFCLAWFRKHRKVKKQVLFFRLYIGFICRCCRAWLFSSIQRFLFCHKDLD